MHNSGHNLRREFKKSEETFSTRAPKRDLGSNPIIQQSNNCFIQRYIIFKMNKTP